MESTEAVEHSEELERRGMKPEVKDVEFVLGADTEDTDGDEDDGISMIVINNVPVAVFSCNQAKVCRYTLIFSVAFQLTTLSSFAADQLACMCLGCSFRCKYSVCVAMRPVYSSSGIRVSAMWFDCDVLKFMS